MNAAQFRAESMLHLFLENLHVFVVFLIWRLAYIGHDQINGYTLSQMIEFYLLYGVLSNSIGAHFEESRVQEIRQGKIDFFLIRPVSYLWELFLAHLGGKLHYFTISFPAIAVIFWLLSQVFHVEFSTLSTLQWIEFIGLFLSAFLFEFLLGLIIVLCGFWLEGADGLVHFKWFVMAMCGGTIVPKPFMPTWLRSLVEQLPFQYVFAVPIELVQHNRLLTQNDVLYLSLTFGFLFLLVLVLWRHAVKRYSSAGG